MSMDDQQLDIETKDPPTTRSGLLKFEPSTPIEIKTKEDLINTITLYFNTIAENETLPTFTGLALFLGITRAKLLDLPQNNNFTPIIERAKQIITDFAEKQLFMPKSAAGVQFWLKNNDNWVDKQDISITKPKTMIDILQEIENQDPTRLPTIEGEITNPNQETNFLKHGEHQPTATEPSPASNTPSAEGQGMEIEKPLSDYRQAR